MVTGRGSLELSWSMRMRAPERAWKSRIVSPPRPRGGGGVKLQKKKNYEKQNKHKINSNNSCWLAFKIWSTAQPTNNNDMLVL